MASVSFGDPEVFNYFLYGEADDRTQNYLAQRVESFTNSIGEAASSFFGGVQKIVERLDESEALRRGRALVRAAKDMFKRDFIVPLTELEDFQTASLTMQRWIMAEETTRTMFHNNQLDGYSSSYVDVQPNAVGEFHYDYRRVTDGLVMVDESDDPDALDWFVDVYYEPLKEGDRELALEEQSDIFNKLWVSQRRLLKSGNEDFTDEFGSLIQ